MSKKTELKTLITDVAYNLNKAFSYAQEQNEYMFNTYQTKIASDASQIEYLLGSREPEFEAKTELKTTPYGCTDDQMAAYMGNMDFTACQRCTGISKLAALDVIDEMF